MLTRSRKAFTLLELIVVIVILGILAALAIPTFQAVIDRAKQSNVDAAARSFAREVDALAAFDQAPANSTTSYADDAITDLAGTGVTASGNTSPITLTKDGKTATVTLSAVAGVKSTTSAD